MTVTGNTAALQAVPPRAVEPRDDRRPPAPAEAPRRPPQPVHRRPPPLGGDSERHRGRVYDSPSKYDDAANRRVYHTPERYDAPRSVRRVSGGPDYNRREDDRASAQRGKRPDRGPPSAAPESGPQGRGDETDRRRRRSPSPETARRLRYDAPDARRQLD